MGKSSYIYSMILPAPFHVQSIPHPSLIHHRLCAITAAITAAAGAASGADLFHSFDGWLRYSTADPCCFQASAAVLLCLTQHMVSTTAAVHTLRQWPLAAEVLMNESEQLGTEEEDIPMSA